jgi:hypothetical protein
MTTGITGPFSLDNCQKVGSVINTAGNEDVIVIYNTTVSQKSVALRSDSTNQGVLRLYTNAGATAIQLGAAQDSYTIAGLAVGVNTLVASARLQADSTTKGFLPPRMTTAQKNAIGSPAEGLVVYDTDLHKICVKGAAAWETVTSI